MNILHKEFFSHKVIVTRIISDLQLKHISEILVHIFLFLFILGGKLPLSGVCKVNNPVNLDSSLLGQLLFYLLCYSHNEVSKRAITQTGFSLKDKK